MSKTKIELNSSAIQALLKSPEVEKSCMDQIRRIQTMCGPGYEVDTYTGRTRVNAMIKAVTPAARLDNAEHHTIENALRSLK